MVFLSYTLLGVCGERIIYCVKYANGIIVLRMSSVYFVQANDGHIKIGLARDVQKRLASLQTAHAHELVLLVAIEGTFRLEQSLHRKFAHLRLRGEWFRPEPELLELIAQSKADPGTRPIPVSKPGPKMLKAPHEDQVRVPKVTARILSVMLANPARVWSAGEMGRLLNVPGQDCGRLMRANRFIERIAEGKYQLVEARAALCI